MQNKRVIFPGLTTTPMMKGPCCMAHLYFRYHKPHWHCREQLTLGCELYVTLLKVTFSLSVCMFCQTLRTGNLQQCSEKTHAHPMLAGLPIVLLVQAAHLPSGLLFIHQVLRFMLCSCTFQLKKKVQAWPYLSRPFLRRKLAEIKILLQNRVSLFWTFL